MADLQSLTSPQKRKGKKEKNSYYNTGYSDLVTHLSTSLAEQGFFFSSSSFLLVIQTICDSLPSKQLESWSWRGKPSTRTTLTKLRWNPDFSNPRFHETLDISNQTLFPLDLLHSGSIISPTISRTLDFSKTPITRTNFGSRETN